MKKILLVCAAVVPLSLLTGFTFGNFFDLFSVKSEISTLLPRSGTPDMKSVNDLYNKIVSVAGAAANSTRYEFTPEEIQYIATLGLDEGYTLEERWEMMRAELEERHPGKIAPSLKWTFNAAGNVICNIAVVYAAPNEYVAFFGTPIGATGFSGYYPKSDVWDAMVEGTMYTYEPGQFEATEYTPGQTAYLKKGSRRVFRYVDSCWMIDYARGNIASMFPYGVINPAMYNTLDPVSAWEQISNFAELCFKNLFKL